MNTEKRKTVDMLTRDSVSILTQEFINLGGVDKQVGDNHRCGYSNSIQGRKDLIQNELEDVINAVMAMWGDEPTITDSPQEEPAGTGNDELVIAESDSEESDDTGDGGDEPAE